MNILFKETIRVESRGYHKLKKQNGGPGQFAVVDLFVRPLPRGGGFRFLNSVVEGRVPEEFVPSVEKGAKEAFMKGVLAGFPVVDVEVELVDGERHRKDSHARDFQIAGRTAVQEALQAASPDRIPRGDLSHAVVRGRARAAPSASHPHLRDRLPE